MPDMLVKLYNMPRINEEKKLIENGVEIKRAMALDKTAILDFVRSNFYDNWVDECEKAIFNQPSTCYIAVKDKKVIGFACYDATALGVFGPTGVSKEARGKGVGKALFGKCLESMLEKGYAYAIVGWVTDATDFYKKAANATVIEDSLQDKSVYKNLINN